MNAAALPGCSLAAAGNGFLEAGMGVADYQLHAREPALSQAAQEGGPEGLVLTVTHFDPQHLPLACRGNAYRHDHGSGDHLLTDSITPLQGL
jgi:hypothetical protein